MSRVTAICGAAFVVLLLLRVWLTVKGRRAVVIGRTADGTEVLVRRHGDVRELVLAKGSEELVQSRSDGSGYQREFHRAMRRTPRPQRLLFLGGGAGIVPMQFERRYADITMDVVENEPLVVEAAKKHFDFRESERVKLHVADARDFLATVAPGSYDLVVLDLYDANGIPAALKTPEFFAGVKAAGRLAVMNLTRPVNESILALIRATFDDVEIEDATAENALVFAATSSGSSATSS